MKQLLPKFWAKFVAGLLFVVMTALCLAAVTGVAVLADGGAYADGGARLRENVLFSQVYQNVDIVADYYGVYQSAQELGENTGTLSYYESRFAKENSNYFFTITDADGNVLLSNYTDAYQYSDATAYTLHRNPQPRRETKTFSSEEAMSEYLESLYEQYGDRDVSASSGSIVNEQTGEETFELQVQYTVYDSETVTITGYVRSNLEAKDEIYYNLFWLDKLISARNWLIVIGASSLVLTVALLVFLLSSAGHKEGEEEIHLTWFDRIPLDLLLFIWICLGGITVAMGDVVYSQTEEIVFASMVVLCWVPLILVLLMSFASRVKAGTVFKNNVLYWLLTKIKKFLLWLWHGLCYLVRSLPLYWKAGVFWAALSLLEMMFVLVSGSGETLTFWFFEKLVLTAVLILIVINMRRLQEGAKRIAAGEVDYTIDLTHMIGDFKAHGEDLNCIRDGLQTAVDERVKSERMKAELITNVSHDIKTPLTSIVNYVDLLKKEELGSDTAREYVAVLERQAQRLKKLTEDVVEASKASTGSIPVNLERTDLNVLLSQAAGEFTDRFAEQKLELRFSASQEQTYVMADGRLLWRVFSNLMSNVGKYALEGTRVYLSIDVQRGRGVISLKNISRYPLNVSGEELMERFVRGDKSRTSEGSGLGLSIARSLTELQGGVFDITVDGDLFKVTISFETA
ncbi:MAG: HAMP domain-containing sensor histidine kinase [Oscillospiraceae bacterium]|nr:HAMP domain-containing sensor histidine kinase [Oscillospiraceae bacterium]